jgi:hypothetical protein
MKEARPRFFFLLFVALALSCDDEPEEVLPPTDNKISYSHYYDQVSGWVVFSDEDGKVLHFEQMARQKTISHEGFQGTTITMTVMLRQSNSWFIKTFTGIAPREYRTEIPQYFVEEALGHHFLRIPNLYSASTEYMIGSDKLSWAFYDITTNTIDLNLFDSTGFLYAAWVPINFVPRYTIRPIKVGEETVFSSTEYEQMKPMNRLPLLLARPANGNINLSGKTKSGKEIGLVNEYFLSNSVGYVSFPEELDLFTSFHQRIGYSIPGSSIWFEHSVEGTTLQNEFFPLPINLAGLNEKDYPVLDFEATGVCDYFEASMTDTRQNLYINWTVYGEFKGSSRVVLPRFTSEMRSKMHFEVEGLTFSTLRFTDNGNVNSYSDWYSAFIKNDYETSRNLNVKQFFLGN